jgi:hypothetical protein
MFEAFESRQVDRRKWIVPAVAVVVGIAVMMMLILLWRRVEERRALERLRQMWNTVTSFVRVELPGMWLNAPSAPTLTGDYATGSVSQLVPEWTVAWQSGKLPPADVLQSTVEAMMRALEQQRHSPVRLASATDVTLDGDLAWQYKLEYELDRVDYSVWITIGECDGRVLRIVNGGVSFQVEHFHNYMVKSFRCWDHILRPPGQVRRPP